jgi:6-phosphogluconolactonase (cycloisomerase 2 family)
LAHNRGLFEETPIRLKEREMRKFVRLAVGAGAVLGLSAWVAPAVAGAEGVHGGQSFRDGADHVVFVQTDNPTGNQVVAYDRADNGRLALANTYNTGGLGGVLNGSAVDHLASQGSLAYDQQDALLYAVNAGSNTVSVFSVRDDELDLRQVVGSGGTFPVSVAVHGNLVYVLNAENGGSVQGYIAFLGHLFPLPGSNRTLGLVIPTDTTQFTNTPGQVAFSPDGSKLIVTTKLNLSDIDVFGVGPFGILSASPVVNSEPGTGPFGVSFDRAGNLVVANAANNSLSTFTLGHNGTVSLIDSVATGQAATCWVTPAGGFFYASNAGSATLSGFGDSSGNLTLLSPPTSTGPGTVDGSAVGQFLYVQTGGNGIVDEFQVSPSGSLAGIGFVTVPGAAGGEGIVAF